MALLGWYTDARRVVDFRSSSFKNGLASFALVIFGIQGRFVWRAKPFACAVAAMLLVLFQTQLATGQSSSAEVQLSPTGTSASYSSEPVIVQDGEAAVAPIADTTEAEIVSEEVVEEIKHSFFDHQADSTAHYRKYGDSTFFLPGDGEQFGMLSFIGHSGIDKDDKWAIISRHSMHLLSGPESTPLPPRLYDFVWGFEARDDVGYLFSYDVAAHIGIFSDFEDSARQGVRFPAHAVGYLKTTPNVDLVFGVEYLDRDDIKILPVGGIRIHSNPYIEADLVFPRPQIRFLLGPQSRFNIGAEIGGGSWDIERPNESNDVFTYSDYQVAMGLETLDKDSGDISGFEIGFAFQRELSFRHSPIERKFGDTVFLRWSKKY